MDIDIHWCWGSPGSRPFKGCASNFGLCSSTLSSLVLLQGLDYHPYLWYVFCCQYCPYFQDMGSLTSSGVLSNILLIPLIHWNKDPYYFIDTSIHPCFQDCKISYFYLGILLMSFSFAFVYEASQVRQSSNGELYVI